MIRKGNVAIRRLRDNEEDMRLLCQWLTDPRVIAHAYGEDAPWDLKKVWENFQENTREDSPTAGCMILYEGEAVGYLQYYPVTEDSYKFNQEVPYKMVRGSFGTDMFIGRPALWRRGIGRQAVELLGTYLKEQFGVRQLCADPATDNACGMHFWPQAGFQTIGLVEEYDDCTRFSALMVKQL